MTAALGYGTRALPTPLYLPHHAFALVPTAHAIPVMDLSAPEIPLFGVAAAADRDTARHTLAEAAFRHRLPQEDVPGVGFGAGTSIEEATERARWNAVESLAVRAPLGPPAKDLTGTLPTSILRAVREIDGTIEARGYGARTVVVELALRRAPYLLLGLGCGPDATERALTAVLTKFAVFSLPRLHSAPWIEAAHDPDAAHHTVPASKEVAEIQVLARTLHTEDGLCVVQARLAEPPRGEPDPLLTPADVPVLGLRGPTQLTMDLAPQDVRLSRVFHENSKLRLSFRTSPLFDASLAAAPIRRALGAAARDFGHTAHEVRLHRDRTRVTRPVEECLRYRRSWAPMAGPGLALADLSHLLLNAYGVTGSGLIAPAERVPLRATPSGGGLYSNDLFVLVDRVEGLPKGLYYYHPDQHRLQLVRSDVVFADVAAQTGYAQRVEGAAALVIYVGAFRRNQWKYWERGYRTVLLDCGHLAQNVIVVANGLDLVAHPMAGFVDDYFNDLVGVDGVEDAVLHLTLLGRKGKS